MKSLIIGYGVQGKKRANYLKEKSYLIYDKFNSESDFSSFDQIPLEQISHAYICLPEKEKYNYIYKLLKKKINILVEKPLILTSKEEFNIKKILKKKKATLYTAYNHRFEPHFIKTKKILDSGIIGKIYNVELYYGNGTAKLWKNSWREKNKESILYDLGVHLLDTFNFWFGFLPEKFYTSIKSKNELKCFDFVNFNSEKKFKSSFTVSVIDWRNKFEANIIGEKGSIHINSLCKWGPSKLTVRKRIFPSGKPKERIVTKICNDPTWNIEEKYFRKISKQKINNFSNDVLIKKSLNKIL
jgi:predicted dehydrogenase